MLAVVTTVGAAAAITFAFPDPTGFRFALILVGAALTVISADLMGNIT